MLVGWFVCFPYGQATRDELGKACQAPLSVGFSRQEYWSGLPFTPPGDLSDLGIEPCLLWLLHWQVGSLSFEPPGKHISHEVMGPDAMIFVF